MTTLKDLLNNKNCLKVICGAGNENITEVQKLVSIYYEAGCRFFDVSMSQEVLEAAKKCAPDAFFCVSTGIKGDPHTLKAYIDKKKCKKCGKCYKVCPTDAMEDISKCIGCMRCKKACKYGAIKVLNEPKDIKEILPQLKGYDCIELHCSDFNGKETLKKWEFISKHFDGFLSICFDRSKVGNEKYIKRIKRMIKDRTPYTTIVQADGAPMSGGEDDYKTTLQAVAMAEIVQNAELPVYILLSGGTNSKSKELAKLCGVEINGIAVGSFARKIVKDLPHDEAVKAAKQLIQSSY